MDHRLTRLPDSVTATLFRYRLPLKRTIEIAPGRVLSDREGTLLKLEDGEGNEGWGEAAPLPGFSDETVEDVIESARRWKQRSTTEGPPTLVFASDGAVADLDAAQRGITLAASLGARRDRLDINGLLNDDKEITNERLAHNQARTLKMKVGRRSVDEDVDRVRRVRERLGTNVRLRLDANRAWEIEDARRFFAGTAGVDVEYVEEPLRDPSMLHHIAEEFAVPIALDESTREIEASDLRDMSWCSAIVLKPSLMGSLDLFQEFVDAASQADITVVLSSAYESGIGLRILIAMAASLPKASAHGFEPYRSLASDVLDHRIGIHSYQIDVKRAMARRRIRYEMLDEVK